MKKIFSEADLEIYNTNLVDIITTSEGLEQSDTSDDGYGDMFDFDDYGL
jgi:hypothetical protein